MRSSETSELTSGLRCISRSPGSIWFRLRAGNSCGLWLQRARPSTTMEYPLVSSIGKASISPREIIPVATDRLTSTDFSHSSHSISHATAIGQTSSWNCAAVTIEALNDFNYFPRPTKIYRKLSIHREQLIEPARNLLQLIANAPLLR